MGWAQSKPPFKPPVGGMSREKEDGPAQGDPDSTGENYDSNPGRLIRTGQDRPLPGKAQQSQKKNAAQADAAIQDNGRASFCDPTGGETRNVEHAGEIVARRTGQEYGK